MNFAEWICVTKYCQQLTAEKKKKQKLNFFCKISKFGHLCNLIILNIQHNMHNNVLYAEKLRNTRNMQKYALLTQWRIYRGGLNPPTPEADPIYLSNLKLNIQQKWKILFGVGKIWVNSPVKLDQFSTNKNINR